MRTSTDDRPGQAPQMVIKDCYFGDFPPGNWEIRYPDLVSVEVIDRDTERFVGAFLLGAISAGIVIAVVLIIAGV